MNHFQQSQFSVRKPLFPFFFTWPERSVAVTVNAVNRSPSTLTGHLQRRRAAVHHGNRNLNISVLLTLKTSPSGAAGTWEGAGLVESGKSVLTQMKLRPHVTTRWIKPTNTQRGKNMKRLLWSKLQNLIDESPRQRATTKTEQKKSLSNLTNQGEGAWLQLDDYKTQTKWLYRF